MKASTRLAAILSNTGPTKAAKVALAKEIVERMGGKVASPSAVRDRLGL